MLPLDTTSLPEEGEYTRGLLARYITGGIATNVNPFSFSSPAKVRIA